MRRSSLFMWCILVVVFWMVPASYVLSQTDDITDFSGTSYKVDLLNYTGGSGDIQVSQNGWIHLGANHLEGGDIKYEVPVGWLNQADILEVWVDGYSTSNDLDIGPTVFIGAGKNRFEQITRRSGDAWRPFVFRFADDLVYGDVTDPSNRNDHWRTRYPSTKYEVRRIDKSPMFLIDNGMVPIRISMTGAEDFIIKRIEVIVSRTGVVEQPERLYIVNLTPYTVNQGDLLFIQLNRGLPGESVDFYLIDPAGYERKFIPSILRPERDKIGLSVYENLFPKNGRYQIKLVDRSDPEQVYTDMESFEYVYKEYKPKPTPTPKPLKPTIPCPPPTLPSIPQPPPTYIIPVPPGGYPGSVAPAPQPIPAPAYTYGYTIQVGAFQLHSAALNLYHRLRSEGFDAYIVESSKAGKPLFRVRVGRYPDKSLAQREAARLKSRGFDTWVTEMS